VLHTPREVRHALVYVVHNGKHHPITAARSPATPSTRAALPSTSTAGATPSRSPRPTTAHPSRPPPPGSAPPAGAATASSPATTPPPPPGHGPAPGGDVILCAWFAFAIVPSPGDVCAGRAGCSRWASCS
jgi:hypothetical protein